MLPSEKNAEKPVKSASTNTYVMTLMITVSDEAALKAEAAAAAAGGDLSAEEWADLRLGVACDLEMVVNPLCGPGYWVDHGECRRGTLS
jgi:hypothetical protein